MLKTSGFQMRSQYFAKQYSRNRIVRDLIVGLPALRGVSDIIGDKVVETEYLPRFPNEPNEFYALRVMRTFLTNYFKRTVTSDSGKILANNVMVSVDEKTNDDLPEPFRTWIGNMDLAVNNLTMLIQNQLQASMYKGLSMVMIDYDNDGKRPYAREIDIDDVISFKSNPKTGRLSYLKFYFDYITDSEEHGSEIVRSVFELTPTYWTIYIDGDEKNTVEGEITRYRNGSQRILDEVPVSVFYTNKKGTLLAESPYQTLAELTIEHFQVYSDIKNMMFYALTPILAAKNVPMDFKIEMLASYMMVRMPESGDKSPELSWIQVDSGAIQEGNKQLEGIQQRISTFSIDSNALRPGTLTATQTSIESQGTNAALRSFAVSLSQHVEDILRQMESYTIGKSKDIKGYISPEFNSLESDKEMRILMEMRRNQDISRKAIVEAALQRKLLSPDFNLADDAAKLEEELKKEMEFLDAKEAQKAKFDKAQQTSQGLLAGAGNEQISDKPRDA